jgi:hypothetical protein
MMKSRQMFCKQAFLLISILSFAAASCSTPTPGLMITPQAGDADAISHTPAPTEPEPLSAQRPLQSYPAGASDPSPESVYPVPQFDPSDQVLGPIQDGEQVNPIYLPMISLYNRYFVSTKGSNADGRTRATAWNELDQIDWSRINPGDTIEIAGGIYHTSMEVGRSGQPGLPIVITTNGEQVIFDGGNPLLPYCDQANYPSVLGEDGIDLEGRSYITIDGRTWSGIIIRNHRRGINMRERTSNITVRNVEFYNNGTSKGSDTKDPSGQGVALGGSNILFERVILHDNGQDAFQVGSGVWNFVLRKAWLYNSREHPTQKGLSFNYCVHTDGLQIFDGGLQGPVTIENSIIGPSFTQGVIIGSRATVNNVIISNTLIVANDNAGIIISEGGTSSYWTLKNVTVVHIPAREGWSVRFEGSNHNITNSIFYGGTWGIWIKKWSAASRNYNWLTEDWDGIASEVDPAFVDPDYSAFAGDAFAAFDFAIQNRAIPAGV